MSGGLSNIHMVSSKLVSLLSKCPNHEEDCANFCGLLRKAEQGIIFNLPLNLISGKPKGFRNRY